MAVKYTKPKGTLDVLPGESWKWQFMEGEMHKAANIYGYREIRLPTFEATEVFSRGVGEGTDIVAKEMYTFTDKGGRSVTLRPEGTAGVVRAVLENGLLNASPLPLKNYYLQSAFRYENNQKGRYREFHQFGVECFGTADAAADTEVMALAYSLLGRLGLDQVVALEINSIGCPACRPRYHQALREYYAARLDGMCPTCQERFEQNPMRLLDCKEKTCAEFAKDAPKSTDYLCEECEIHFETVKQLLNEAGMSYTVNPRIVRGLDYYTKTVFEFVAAGIGTQGTVCGGGRYDGLIEQLGGAPTPAVGFGLGVERLLMLLEEHGRLPEAPTGPVLYAVGMGAKGRATARRMASNLRGEGLAAEYDIANRSVKAQMKAAGRLGAMYTMVLGDEEVESGIAKLKRMKDGSEVEIPLVTVRTTITYLYAQDPLTESEEDLQLMVDAAGPSVIFGQGE